MRNRSSAGLGGAGVDAAANEAGIDRCGNIAPSKRSCLNDAASARVNKKKSHAVAVNDGGACDDADDEDADDDAGYRRTTTRRANRRRRRRLRNLNR